MVSMTPVPTANDEEHDKNINLEEQKQVSEITENGNSKKFAVLLCADDSEYVKKQYGGYFGVFVKMLAEEGESWDVYRVARNEFPSDPDVEKYDGFVITGSCNDAHGNDAWICRLVSFLKRLDLLEKKVLGICFGHQILGRALGGKIGRAVSGWDIGLRAVNFSASSSKLFATLSIPPKLSVIECHQDEILELPSKVEVIGWSNKTSIEVFTCGDHMMGIQGHPEYNRDILLHLIDRLLLRDIIGEKVAFEMRSKFMETNDPDKEEWRKLCINFLKGRL